MDEGKLVGGLFLKTDQQLVETVEEGMKDLNDPSAGPKMRITLQLLLPHFLQFWDRLLFLPASYVLECTRLFASILFRSISCPHYSTICLIGTDPNTLSIFALFMGALVCVAFWGMPLDRRYFNLSYLHSFSDSMADF